MKLRIEGMTCGHCVAAVTRILESIPGVSRVVEVSLERGEAVIDGAPDPAALITPLKEEGFHVDISE